MKAQMMNLVRVSLRPHQSAALALFAEWFAQRHGEKSLDLWRNSAILRMVNNADTVAVGNELLNWVYTDDAVDESLVLRRVRERMLWEGRTK